MGEFSCTIKGALYGIEPSTRTAKFGRPARRQHCQYLKISYWIWIKHRHAPLFSNLLQMFPQLHCPGSLLKAMSQKIATTVITRHACLVSCRSFVHRSAAQHRQRQQDIFRYWRCCLSRVDQILPFRVEGSIPYSAPLTLTSCVAVTYHNSHQSSSVCVVVSDVN